MLMSLMAVGALIGALDCIMGNRFGLGERFEEGFLCMGSVALNMVGIICLAPAAGNLLKPVLVPAFHLAGVDPAMFGCLFANNMGGYPLAITLAENQLVGLYSGLIVSSMLGAAIVYTIPVGLGLVREEDRGLFAKGVMIGLIPVPVGAFAGGLMIGLPPGLLFINTLPVIGAAALLLTGFFLFQDRLLKGFLAFAKGIRAITILGLGLAAFTGMSHIVLIPGMTEVEEALGVVTAMGVIQLGSLPLASLFLRIFRQPLARIGGKLSMNPTAMASLPISCVNIVSVFTMIKDMNPRGIVVSAAWSTSAICVFTAHLSYTQTMAPEMTGPVMAAKLISAVLAVPLALAMTRKMK